MKARARLRRLTGRALAVLSLGLAAALIWAALDLYLTGRALRAAEPSAVIFSRAAVAARLPVLLPALGLWLLAWLAALAAGGGTKPGRAPTRQSGQAAEPLPDRRSALLRWGLLGLALVLLILGVLGGGLRDVFIKAANLCTECIGLG